jgi:F-type H+-transporting ATPase subunit b
MTIDPWGLGLQAINVLILAWLLSRVFWRPVSKAIATRHEAAQTLLNNAKAAKSEADSVLAEVTRIRAGLATEREALIAGAATEGEVSAKATLVKASVKAEKLLKAARLAGKRETEIARSKTVAEAALLALDIARKLLARLDNEDIHAGFLGSLVKAIDQMNPKDRAALAAHTGSIDFVSPSDLKAAEKAKTIKAVWRALGGKPVLNFVTNPDLIAGFEIRTTHLVLHASWQSDLAAILKDLKNAV